MNEAAVRDEVVKWAKSMFDRGLTGGSSGNISVRLEDGFLATPTNSCLGFLDPARLSRLDAKGKHVEGDAPTKELPLHFAFYAHRPEARAVVHLHSSCATALSCLADVDPADMIPAITPYVVMRVGKVPLVPYARPGSDAIVPDIARLAPGHAAVLISNHGPVVSAASLEAAVFAMEELEEAAKLAILTRGLGPRRLDARALADLEAAFGRR